MANERAILCGGARPGRGKRWARPLVLRTAGPDAEVTLRIAEISPGLAALIPPRYLDLLEVATYVYVADQAVRRGGDGVDNLGAEWRRRLHFRVPVRDLDFWRAEAVAGALVRTLGFLSDDEYHFEFEPTREPPPAEHYCLLGPEWRPRPVEEVVLFSGGLDSLGGAVREAVVDRRRVALVMHRPTEKLRARHDLLGQLLDGHSQASRPQYVPVTVNKDKSLGREYTQRSRSFLYAALGAAVAEVSDLSRLRFYENGVVSLNLPLSPQAVGSKATRTTHPRVLAGFAQLLSLVAGRPFAVENPFVWRTKAEVVRQIAEAGCADTIAYSTSCTHTWEIDNVHFHCGACSQCIDRRFAVLAAGQAAHDPAGGYKVDLLVGARDAGEHRTMLAAYVETALAVARMTPLDFFGRYGEVARAVRHLPGSADAAAGRIYDLYRRHARAVGAVVDEAIGGHSAQIRERALPDSCLLRLVCDTSGSNGAVVGRDADARPLPAREPAMPGLGENALRRKGQAWVVRFGGRDDFILLPSKGAAYLHMLLSAPGRRTSVVDMVFCVANAPGRFALGDAGPRNDADARDAYRVRFQDLTEELAAAKRCNDEAGKVRLGRELADLAAELKSRGWGGASKRDSDDRERMRKAFRAAFRRVIKDISKFDRSLAAHLDATVTCGTSPVYQPARPIDWEL